MMRPLQVGRPNKHVNASNGADNNVMKFYITEYSSHIGIEDYQPRKGYHTGTGYKSNLRPGVYYSRKLDELDNPVMGHVVNGNYKSLSHTDFRQTRDCNGKEPLPMHLNMISTGFAKDQHRTTPSEREAYSMFPDLIMSGHEQKLPLLHTLKQRDPIAEDNNNRGPAYHSTENHTQFVKKDPHVDVTDKNVGANEETGFTRSKNVEPLTHYPDSCYHGNNPTLKSLINPPVPSVMKTSFLPSKHLNGRENLGDLNTNGNLESGFTRFIQPKGAHTSAKGKVYTKMSDVNNPFAVERIKKNDPAEYINMNNPKPYPSLSKSAYTGRQINGPDAIEKLSRTNLGKKENTGHTDNNQNYRLSPKDSAQFNTLYDGQFYDKNRILKTEYPRINDACAKNLQDNGYTKSEKLHPPTDDYDVGRQLKFLHPYVNRSLKARHPSYGGDNYAHKTRNILIG